MKTIEEIKAIVEQNKEYNFLKTNPHLGSNIIMLGLGGSYAYGTANEDSDIDIRGIALNTKEEILLNRGFDQVLEDTTDTCIYSLKKILLLLSNCNPNTIELLGLDEDQYVYLNDIGRMLLDKKSMFLSKKAVHSFGGYATSQLRRLDNKAARTASQIEQEKHILNSIENAKYTFPEKYFPMNEDDYINLYIGKSPQEEYDTEIFMDVHLTQYPLRDYKSMWSEMNNVVKDYSKLGKRNSHAIQHNKLTKHMMHLFRLYHMAFDILEHGQIITHRKDDLQFLLDIRNGCFLDSDNQPTKEMFELINEYDKKLSRLAETSKLPNKPDYTAIDNFLLEVNSNIVKGEI